MLGDIVEQALNAVGISRKRVESWLGNDCSGCERRKQRLNALHGWAMRVASGKVKNAHKYFEQITGEKDDD